MKFSPKFSPICASQFLTAGWLSLCTPAAHADLVAGWDFQGSTAVGGPFGTVISMPPTTPRDFTSNVGIFQAFSHLYFDGSFGSSSFFIGSANADTELGALNGITANAGTNFSTATGAPSGGSLALFNRTAQGGIDGKSAVFKLSMDGYQDLAFSFAVQRPVSAANDYGVSLFTFSYGTDGVNYQPWGSIDTGFATSVINQAYSLGPVLQAVNDADIVYIKMTVSGSTGGVNSARVDNIQFNATPTPEPTAIAGLLAGVALLGTRRRSRVS